MEDVRDQSSLETCTSEHQERNPRARFPEAIRARWSCETSSLRAMMMMASANLAAEDSDCNLTCTNPAFNQISKSFPIYLHARQTTERWKDLITSGHKTDDLEPKLKTDLPSSQTQPNTTQTQNHMWIWFVQTVQFI